MNRADVKSDSYYKVRGGHVLRGDKLDGRVSLDDVLRELTFEASIPELESSIEQLRARNMNDEVAYYKEVVSNITRKHFAEKDRQFEALKATGEWPYKTCEACHGRAGCCHHIWHHRGDCCLHCGNDERKD